jgi:hypothetical protein
MPLELRLSYYDTRDHCVHLIPYYLVIVLLSLHNTLK